MKKIYTYFCLLLVGSFLPFMIVEFYFQNYITLGLLALVAIVILALCLSIEYLIRKFINKPDAKEKTISGIDWVKKKEESGRPATYFFRNRLH